MISTPSTGATLVVVTFDTEALLLVLFGGSEVVAFSAGSSYLERGFHGVTVVFSSEEWHFHR